MSPSTIRLVPAAPSASAPDQLAHWQRRARIELPRTRLEGQPGPWVSISACPPQMAHFHQTEQEAERAVSRINDSGCGGKGCRGSHPLPGLLAQHWSMPLD